MSRWHRVDKQHSFYLTTSRCLNHRAISHRWATWRPLQQPPVSKKKKTKNEEIKSCLKTRCTCALICWIKPLTKTGGTRLKAASVLTTNLSIYHSSCPYVWFLIQHKLIETIRMQQDAVWEMFSCWNMFLRVSWSSAAIRLLLNVFPGQHCPLYAVASV